MAPTPDKPSRRRGRPTRKEEVRRALAEVGCDPMAIDPLRILAGIAADELMPPTARVAAAKALIVARAPDGPDGSAADAQIVDAGAISVRALELLKAGRGH